MKRQSLKKFFAFIITLLICSAMPASVSAQKKCPDGNCPKGQSCVDGFCVKSGGKGGGGNGGGGGGDYCNCSVRPIPFQCGQICGWLVEKTFAINSKTLSFQLTEAQNVSIKIYDATGRLIRTLADRRMPGGDYEVEWDKRDESGNAVDSGIYILQLDAGTYSSSNKVAVNK